MSDFHQYITFTARLKVITASVFIICLLLEHRFQEVVEKAEPHLKLTNVVFEGNTKFQCWIRRCGKLHVKVNKI